VSESLKVTAKHEGSFCSHGKVSITFAPVGKVRVTCLHCDEVVIEGLPEEVFVMEEENVERS
jgi:hypothetical protein